MNRLLLRSGSAAFLMSGFGPRIMLALDDGGGAGGAAAAGAGAAGAGAAGAGAAAGDGGAAAGGAGAAAAGTGDAAAAAGGAAAGAGQAAGAEGGGSTVYRPDGLPDHLLGANEKETIDKLWTATKGFRDGQAKYEPPPADAAGYAFEWSDKVKPYTETFDTDPAFKGLRDDLLEAGIGTKAASKLIDKTLARWIDGGLVHEPVDIEAEKAKLAPADAKDLPAPERDAAIQRRVATNVAFVDSLKAKGFDAQAATDLSAELAAFPALNQLVEFVRGGAGGDGPALGGGSGQGVSKSDLDKRMADPRGRVGEASYDADFARETDRLFKQHYPG